MLSKENILSSIKNYKFNSLFVKNLLIIILLLVIPLNSICLFFYYINNNLMIREIYNTNLNLIYTVRNITDSVVKQAQTLTINTALQEDVYGYLLNPSTDNHVHPNQKSINKYIKNYLYTKSYLDSIYIYSEKNDTVLSDSLTVKLSGFADKNWIHYYNEMRTDEVQIILRARNDNYPYYLSIIKPVFATDTNRIGAIVVNVNIQSLTNEFRDIQNTSPQNIYIINENKEIIYSENQDEITKTTIGVPLLQKIIKNEDMNAKASATTVDEYVCTSTKSQNFHWTYYSVMSLNFYHDKFVGLITMLIMLVGASILIAAILAFYITLRTYKPITNIMEFIDSPEKWIDNIYTDTPKNETSYILKRIGNTLKDKVELQSELDARMMLLKHAQTVALQSQINPHFLYNTLDAINWMAINKLNGENEISDSITILGDLFKLNIDTSDYLTAVSSEITYTEQYIKILQFRYGNLFLVEWEIGDEVMEIKIPRLTLQPIIENALYHGIKPKKEKGFIKISLVKLNNDFVITVQDNGIGIDEFELNELNKALAEDYVFFGKHVGLKNINQRIKLIYGNEYGVQVESDNFGTIIKIILPDVE